MNAKLQLKLYKTASDAAFQLRLMIAIHNEDDSFGTNSRKVARNLEQTLSKVERTLGLTDLGVGN